MGIIISNRILAANKMLGLPSPILLCSKRNDYCKAISDAGIQTISLNLPLAKKLVGKNLSEITANITAIVLQLMPDGTPILLTDYEMLFDPRYNLDVLKLFSEIARHSKLIVKWCGSFDNDSLLYSEPGYDDYSKYRISDYEIYCVV